MATQISYTVNLFGLSLLPGETHISTDWEIATDLAFTNIIDSSYNDTVNLTSYSNTLNYLTSPPSELYGRYRIKTNLYTYPYSNVLTIYNQFIDLSVSHYYITGNIVINIQPIIPAGQTHVNTDWYVINATTGNEIFKSVADAANLTSITISNPNVTDTLRVHAAFSTGTSKSSMRCDIFTNSISNSFTSAAPYPINTFVASQSTLLDGRVLVVGGWNGSSSINSSYVYDPATNTWSPVANYPTLVRQHSQSTLLDGRVLVVGGYYGTNVLNNCYTYDPVTNIWTAVANYPLTITEHRQTTLLDGRVLVVGGWNGTNVINTCYIYDPTTDTWSPAANYPTVVIRPSISTLLDGRVLVVGGDDANVLYNACYIYDPTTDTWTPAANYPVSTRFQSQVTLKDGKVLVIGGNVSGTWGATDACNIYDPATNTWLPATNYPITISRHTSSLLNNGQVLTVSGHNSTSFYTNSHIYTP